MKKILALCILCLLMACQTSGTKKKELHLFVAASTQKAVQELAEDFMQNNPEVAIFINAAGSGTLALQIQQGAPADVFLSASPKEIKTLDSLGLLERNSTVDLLKNQLVFIGNNSLKGKINSVKDLKNTSFKIAVGDSKIVPAGRYTQEVLQKLNLLKEVHPRLAPLNSVSSVLNMIELGELPVGFVYRSDFLKAKSSFLIQEMDETLHKPIIYPIALVKGSKKKKWAQDFINYLKSEKAKKVFEKYGFRS